MSAEEEQANPIPQENEESQPAPPAEEERPPVFDLKTN